MITKRNYKDYEAYLAHQAKKVDLQRAYFEKTSENRKKVLAGRINAMAEHIPIKSGLVVCVGARMGEEVECWKELGFITWGYDLNPASENVMKGDMHHLNQVCSQGTADIIYCNSLDHALYLDKVNKSFDWVGKKESYLVIDLSTSPKLKDPKHLKWSGSYEAIVWESHYDVLGELTNFRLLELEISEGWHEDKLKHVGWNTYLLKKK